MKHLVDLSTCIYISKYIIIAFFRDCTDRFVSDLVGEIMHMATDGQDEEDQVKMILSHYTVDRLIKQHLLF